MRADGLNKYKLGQKAWFIATDQDRPKVKSAVVTNKTTEETPTEVLVYIMYRDSEGTYRTAPYIPVYKTKKEAEKALNNACREVWKHKAINYEAKVNNLKTSIKLQQEELKEAEENLIEYQKRLEELK